jgi:hypothetical protein
MPSFFGKHRILIKEKVQWYVFLRKYRLPFSLKRDPSWSMDVDDFEVIIDVLRGYRTSESVCLVELGSGVSTLVLAHIVPSLYDDAHIISIEGEESYAQQAQDMLRQHELDDRTKVSWVPYVRSDNRSWFNRPELEQSLSEKRVDILIVDAPPGILCPRARQPAIPFFLPYLKPHSTVMLHDACRPDESLIAKEWSHHFRSCYQIKTSRGFAVFEGANE